jgi:ATP-dependent DNA helicase PIF1
MNVDVDSINNGKYNELIQNGADNRTYNTITSVAGKSWALSLKIPDKIDVCIGAQVVLTWNVCQDDGLINGSRGVIIDFDINGPVVRFVNGQERTIEYTKIIDQDDPTLAISFMPIKLAYALTIHKSQGMTLDAVVLDLGDSIFEYGQAYTAISRVRNLASIKIVDVKRKSFRTHKDVLEFYNKI